MSTSPPGKVQLRCAAAPARPVEVRAGVIFPASAGRVSSSSAARSHTSAASDYRVRRVLHHIQPTVATSLPFFRGGVPNPPTSQRFPRSCVRKSQTSQRFSRSHVPASRCSRRFSRTSDRFFAIFWIWAVQVFAGSVGLLSAEGWRIERLWCLVCGQAWGSEVSGVGVCGRFLLQLFLWDQVKKEGRGGLRPGSAGRVCASLFT